MTELDRQILNTVKKSPTKQAAFRQVAAQTGLSPETIETRYYKRLRKVPPKPHSQSIFQQNAIILQCISEAETLREGFRKASEKTGLKVATVQSRYYSHLRKCPSPPIEIPENVWDRVSQTMRLIEQGHCLQAIADQWGVVVGTINMYRRLGETYPHSVRYPDLSIEVYRRCLAYDDPVMAVRLIRELKKVHPRHYWGFLWGEPTVARLRQCLISETQNDEIEILEYYELVKENEALKRRVAALEKINRQYLKALEKTRKEKYVC